VRLHNTVTNLFWPHFRHRGASVSHAIFQNKLPLCSVGSDLSNFRSRAVRSQIVCGTGGSMITTPALHHADLENRRMHEAARNDCPIPDILGDFRRPPRNRGKARAHCVAPAASTAECRRPAETFRHVELTGPSTTEQRDKLMAIAGKCPVHRTVKSEIDIRFCAS
jgi:hypothetical protein